VYLSPHVTKPAVVALLAALLVPVAASAQNSVAYRVGPGIQLGCGAAAPTAAALRGIFWCKSTDSNKLHYTDPSGSDIALGAAGAGASTLKLTYAAGAAAADSILALDSTRGPLVLRDAASTIGALLQVQNSAGATSYLAITGNSTQQIKSAQADGAGNVGTRVDTTTTYATAKIFQLMTNAVEKWSWQAATANMPANAILAAAASATNTTGLAITSNVADGATSVGLRVNNTTALTTGALMQLANAGTTVLSVTPAATTGVRLTGGTAYLNIDSTNGALLGYGSNYLFVGVTSITANGLPIVSDGVSTLGTSSTPWPVTWSKFQGVTLGSPLTSAATITPTSAMHHVTGTVSVTTIATTNLPTSFTGSLTLICDAACVFATGGNISTGFTGTTNKAYVFWWDGTAWRVQGGG
jgi:hypothetical protein